MLFQRIWKIFGRDHAQGHSSWDVGAGWAGWAVIFVEAKGGRFVID